MNHKMHYKEYKSILSPKNGMNLYRGCTHGCIYCDSRSLCYQFDHDFEDIEIKTNAPAMLERELLKKRKKCVIGTGAMCDPYIHLEEELLQTRKCLEVIARQGFGIAIQTKSPRILRDIELLKTINNNYKCTVQMTLTTFDEELCKIVEPEVSTTRERVEALKKFRDNGIPTVVWFTPILPFLNDTPENVRGIVEYCAEAGVSGILNFGISLTLRAGDREYYYAALDRHFPGLKRKYIERYGNDYIISSPHADELMSLFKKECKKYGILTGNDKIFGMMYSQPKFEEKQISLW